MPEQQIAQRGGAVRWRTVKLKNGQVIHVAVVRKAGPKGGHTVAGEPITPKDKGSKKKGR